MYAGHFDFAHPLLWSVPDLFTRTECAEIIGAEAAHTWLPATVNRLEGRAVDATLRDSWTAVVRDEALAAEVYRRVLPHVPASMTTELGARGRVALDVTGIYVPLRIYKYDPGQHFGLHSDQSYFADEDTVSLLTLMVYLNEGFEGGETDFPEQQRTIAPKTGSALLFQHRVLHAGNAVRSGQKLVLRSDVLYRARE